MLVYMICCDASSKYVFFYKLKQQRFNSLKVHVTCTFHTKCTIIIILLSTEKTRELFQGVLLLLLEIVTMQNISPTVRHFTSISFYYKNLQGNQGFNMYF